MAARRFARPRTPTTSSRSIPWINVTPAPFILEPPTPRTSVSGRSARMAFARLAPCRSPAASPVTIRIRGITTPVARDECADRLQYLVRQLQRRDAVFTGDGGRASSRDGVQERLDLQFERLLISPFHVLDLDLGATMAPGHPSADHSLTSLIVNRHVGVALKQAEPPHASRRHAAGGQIGDAPAAEHDAGVGDVDV